MGMRASSQEAVTAGEQYQQRVGSVLAGSGETAHSKPPSPLTGVLMWRVRCCLQHWHITGQVQLPLLPSLVRPPANASGKAVDDGLNTGVAAAHTGGSGGV